jgi:hypothetical protein
MSWEIAKPVLPEKVKVCNDGVDNDCDGLIDNAPVDTGNIRAFSVRITPVVCSAFTIDLASVYLPIAPLDSVGHQRDSS